MDKDNIKFFLIAGAIAFLVLIGWWNLLVSWYFWIFLILPIIFLWKIVPLIVVSWFGVSTWKDSNLAHKGNKGQRKKQPDSVTDMGITYKNIQDIPFRVTRTPEEEKRWKEYWGARAEQDRKESEAFKKHYNL